MLSSSRPDRLGDRSSLGGRAERPLPLLASELANWWKSCVANATRRTSSRRRLRPASSPLRRSWRRPARLPSRGSPPSCSSPSLGGRRRAACRGIRSLPAICSSRSSQPAGTPCLGTPGRRSELSSTDISYRATVYADQGLSGVLGSLHDSVRMTDGTLTVLAGHPQPQAELDERGLLLIPTALGPRDTVGPVLIGHWQPSLVYPARGSANLGLEASAPSSPLAALLGATRARVLEALVQPQTTSGLSSRLGAAPSTISLHLHTLASMGLCTRRRVGRSVLYQITAAGQALTGAPGASEAAAPAG